MHSLLRNLSHYRMYISREYNPNERTEKISWIQAEAIYGDSPVAGTSFMSCQRPKLFIRT